MDRYEYDAVPHELADHGGTYSVFLWNIPQRSGKGNIKAHAESDGIPYKGNAVNMGLRNENSTACYVIGVQKLIRKALNMTDGDMIHVIIQTKEGGKS